MSDFASQRRGATTKRETFTVRFTTRRDPRRQRQNQLPPNSLDRFVAAVTASRNAERTALASRAASPAAVVPPGEVTAARRASAPSGPWARRVADPRRVWVTRAWLIARGR